MLRLTIILLALSLIGNVIGLYAYYKLYRTEQVLQSANKSIGKLNDTLDGFFEKRMVFLHHSVGDGILYNGGLADSLRAIGINVKSMTYGDEIGNRTDMCDWAPKFQSHIDSIISFKGHPNMFYQDGRANDVVMFKSCFPNSDIAAEGAGPGDPESSARTLANYKAVFERLKEQFAKHPDRLFIHMTTPPLVPKATTPENARRAREFDRWLVAEFLPRYRSESGLDNFAIFDLYDILADGDNYLKQEFRLGSDDNSHPNALANKVAAQKFMEFFRPVWERRQAGSGMPAAQAVS